MGKKAWVFVLLFLAAVVIGGGAYYYFVIMSPDDDNADADTIDVNAGIDTSDDLFYLSRHADIHNGSYLGAGMKMKTITYNYTSQESLLASQEELRKNVVLWRMKFDTKPLAIDASIPPEAFPLPYLLISQASDATKNLTFKAGVLSFQPADPTDPDQRWILESSDSQCMLFNRGSFNMATMEAYILSVDATTDALTMARIVMNSPEAQGIFEASVFTLNFIPFTLRSANPAATDNTVVRNNYNTKKCEFGSIASDMNQKFTYNPLRGTLEFSSTSLKANGTQLEVVDHSNGYRGSRWECKATSDKTVKYASKDSPNLFITDPSGVGTSGTVLVLGTGTEFIRHVSL